MNGITPLVLRNPTQIPPPLWSSNQIAATTQSIVDEISIQINSQIYFRDVDTFSKYMSLHRNKWQKTAH